MTVASTDKYGEGRLPIASPSASRRLFGRVAEVAALTDCYARVRSSGRSEVVLVSGPAGIGKSALVQRVHVLLNDGHHRFAAGKSDPLQRNVALAPVLQMVRGLVDGALGDSDAELNRLRRRVREAIGREARSIVDLVPEAQALVGSGAALPELPPNLAQARNHRAIMAVIGGFATSASPLILLIDDVQWADPSTLSFLSAFAATPPKHVLLAMALREEEASILYEEGGLLEAIRNTDIRVTDLALRGLSLEKTAELLAATLGEVNDAHALASAVHCQTAGNPFFLQQVVQELQEERSMTEGAEASGWNWSDGGNARPRQIGNVLDFVAVRLSRLRGEERDLLALLALMGGRAEAPALAMITRRDVSEARSSLRQLAKSGFVTVRGSIYAFAHDNIREAALALTPPGDRAARHGAIAALLMAGGANSSLEEAFKVAGQLVLAFGSGTTAVAAASVSDKDRLSFASFLHEAVGHAKRAGAGEQVVEYVDCALMLAADDWWHGQYALMFALHFFRCEHMLLRGAVDAAEVEIESLLARAANDVDRAVCHRLMAGLRTVKSDYDGAINAALAGLALLGHPLSRYPSVGECSEACTRVQSLMGPDPAKHLLQLKPATEPTAGLVTSLLSGLFAAIFSEDGLRFLHAATIVELTLRHGVTEDSAHGLAWFGVFIADMYEQYEEGLGFALAALALVERHGFEAQRTAVLIAIDQLSPWTRPLDYAVARVRDAIAAGSAAGDLGMTCYARNHLVTDLILSGERLALVEDEADRGLALTRRIEFRDIEILIAAQRAFVRRLCSGERAAPYETLGEITSASTRFWVRLYDGISSYLFGDLPRAESVFEEAAQLKWAVPANIDLAYYELFAALNAARFHPAERALSAIEPHRERMALWATLNPATFANKLSLVEAEIARLRGDDLSALRLFDQAIDQSSDLVHERGLARELAGRHARRLGLRTASASYLNLSCADYRRWGAYKKAEWVERHCADVLAVGDGAEVSGVEGRTLAIVVDEVRALSKELRFGPLVQQLMDAVMKRSSAESGMLILLRDGDPVIEASSRLVAHRIEVTVQTAIPTTDRLPGAMLKRTLEATRAGLLQEAMDGSERSGRDARNAVFCIPLRDGATTTGAILLFRPGGHNAFAGVDVHGLEILGAQAAVSLVSARRYTELAVALEHHSEAAASLRIARSELARTSHLSVMGGLAASIAHEINQPLASILGYSAAARRWLRLEEPDLGEVLACIDSIHRAGARASEIVQSLRSLAKQESPALLPVSLNSIVKDVVGLIAPEIEAHKVRLTCSFGASDEDLVPGDRVQLQQVLHNFLTNAIDALDGKPATDRRINVTTSGNDVVVVVRVEDNGCGIAPDKIKEVLTPLFTTKSKGMGMGLAICKSIVEAHGGMLGATHASGGGTIFEFTVPR